MALRLRTAPWLLVPTPVRARGYPSGLLHAASTTLFRIFKVRRAARVKVWSGATGGATLTVQVNGLKTVSLVAADTESLAINGGAGNDTLTVNTSSLLTVPVNYDGGVGSNALVVLAGAANQFVVVMRGADANAGTIRAYNSAVANADINYVATQVVSPTVLGGANLMDAVGALAADLIAKTAKKLPYQNGFK